MYNGIGLTTARGSGTNGYVQKSLAHVRTNKRVEYKDAEHRERMQRSLNREPNKDILEHERKRQVRRRHKIRYEIFRGANEDHICIDVSLCMYGCVIERGRG